MILHTGSPVQLRVKWLRAHMFPTKPGVVPSFDDTDSFRLEIDEGLLGISLQDLSEVLRTGPLKDSPLRNAKVTVSGTQLQINGTFHRLVSLPIRLLASFSAAPDHRHMRMHVDKISVLKMPVKGLLGALHLHIADLMAAKEQRGISISGDNVDIDVNEILPPPRTVGILNDVKLWKSGDLMQYYGNPREDAIKIKEWRNFMRLRGGTINFGKLTMHNADLLLVDTSPSDWLNFDVQNYQEQLVNGTTRITPDAGLQIFIPDITSIPRNRFNRDSVRWMRNRNVDPPADVR